MATVDIIVSYCETRGYPVPVREYQFAPPRRWRADYCWVAERLILECEGGVWTQGRHTRGRGFLADVEKYNEATLLGWRLIRCTPQQIKDGTAFALLDRVLS